MSGPADLHALAEELRAACEAALATVPASGAGFVGVPDRSFVTPGQPAFDCCDQLTVHVEQIVDLQTQRTALDSGTKHRSARLPQPLLIATVLRCVPGPDASGNPPLADDLVSAAQQIHADGWALHNVLFNRLQAGTLFENCANVVWEGLRRVGPQGGCGGWTLTVRVELEGYRP